MLKEITIESLWRIFKKRILWLILVGILFTALAGVFTKVFIDPKYSSYASFYVDYKLPDGNNTPSASAIAAAQQIVKTYVEIAKSNTVLKKVIEESGYSGVISEKQLKNMLTSGAQNDTEIFYVKVTSTDKQMAYNIASTYEIVLPLIIEEKMGCKTSVFDEARLADVKDSPSTIKNAMLGGIAGVIVLFFIFCLLEFTRTTVYTENDLKPLFTQPIVGQIVEWYQGSTKKHGRKGVEQATTKDFTNKILNDKTPFMVTESFKTLRTNLFYTANNEKCPVYVITSGMANAGKSVIIANLAISYAQLGDKKVLFIDADMRCPVQHKIFGISNKVGLSELLADNKGTNYIQFIKKVNNIDIITSGRIPPNPSELLASTHMKEFLKTAKNDYDIILIDMPPVGEVSDAGIIAPFVIGYLYVIRSGYTDIRLIKDSMNSMKQMQANVIGFIINDINPKINEGYSAYGYKKYGYKKYGYKRYGYKKYAYEYGYRSADAQNQEDSKK